MSVLEIKSELHKIIVMLQSEKALLKILKSAKKSLEEEDSRENLSSEQIEKLKKSIANSKKTDFLLNHEDIKKKHTLFLSSLMHKY
jgi:hypothetical protein